jgi:hypothetical protein
MKIVLRSIVATLLLLVAFGASHASAQTCGYDDLKLSWSDRPRQNGLFLSNLSAPVSLVIKTANKSCEGVSGKLYVRSLSLDTTNASDRIVDVTSTGLPFTLSSPSEGVPIAATVKFTLGDEDCGIVSEQDLVLANTGNSKFQFTSDKLLELEGLVTSGSLSQIARTAEQQEIAIQLDKLSTYLKNPSVPFFVQGLVVDPLDDSGVSPGTVYTIPPRPIGEVAISQWRTHIPHALGHIISDHRTGDGGTVILRVISSVVLMYECGYTPSVQLDNLNYTPQTGATTVVDPALTSVGRMIDILANDRAFGKLYHDQVSTLLYYCDGACGDEWKIAEPFVSGTSAAAMNTSSACYDPITGEYQPDCYELLAPLPGLGRKISFNDDDFSLGKYFSVMIRIAMGVASLAAVLFITYAGIQYMIAGNSGGGIKLAEAKARITNALIGIGVIAVSWIILNTINPELLNINPVFNKVSFSADISRMRDDQSVGNATNVYTGPSINENITQYDDILKQAAKRAGIDCGLLKAFMYTESGGGRDIYSDGVGARGIVQIMPTTAADSLVPQPDNRKKVEAAMGEPINYKGGESHQQKVHTTLKSLNIIDLDNAEQNANLSAQLIKAFIDNPCPKNAGSTCRPGVVRYALHAYNGGRGKNSKGICGKTKWECGDAPQENIQYGPKVIAAYNKIITSGWSCDPSSKGKGFTSLVN